ncbi:hypothetical protein BOX15_Mlig016134g2, partial [Macrostomum lignano]
RLRMPPIKLAIVTLLLLLPSLVVSSPTEKATKKQPNILILLVDDLGFGDIGANGNTTIRTPNVDRIAKEGVRLSHHLTAAPVCTPSRSALLTGKYPIRMGMVPSIQMQVFPFTASQAGLPTNETTFAKVAQRSGYRTGLIGKWHLGAHCSNSKDFCHHPNNHGFDYFYGCLLTLLKDFSGLGESVLHSRFPHYYRNISLTLLATLASLGVGYKIGILPRKLCIFLALLGVLVTGFLFCLPDYLVRTVNSQLHRQTELVEQPIRFEKLTQRLVWEGEEFLDKAVDEGKPFLLFMSFLQVHSPLYNSVPGYRGRSAHGWYGDNIEEMDWSVGQILDALDKRGLSDDTIVYFSSDNGGHIEETTHTGERAGGHNGIYRGSKCQGAVDGGIRVPGLLRWPGVIPAGSQSNALTSQMDIFPTLLEAMGQPVPSGIDGRSITKLLRQPQSTKSPHDFLFQYCGTLLHAVRWNSPEGVLKLRHYSPNWLPGTEGCRYICGCMEGLGSVRHSVPLLYDLSADERETAIVPADSERYRRLVPQILEAERRHQASLSSVPSQFTFAKLMWRPWLQDCCNFPLCNCRDTKYDSRPA